MRDFIFKIWKQQSFMPESEVLISYNDDDSIPKASWGEGIGQGKDWTYYILQDNLICIKTKYLHNNRNIAPDQTFDNIYDNLKANSIHAFASTRIVLDMFHRSFHRLKDPKIDKQLTENRILKWAKMEFPKLTISLDLDSDYAAYDENNHEIKLGKILAKNPNTTPYYLCRDFDVLSHEVGHAVLFVLRGDCGQKTNKYIEILHEAFADITTIFSLLSMMDICEHLVVQTRGKMTEENNFLYKWGEVSEYHKPIFMRDYNNTGDESTTDAHKSSKLITRIMLQLITNAFERHKNITEYHPAESLYRVGRMMLDIFMYGIVNMKIPPVDDSGASDTTSFNTLSAEKILDNLLKSMRKYFKQEKTNRERIIALLNNADSAKKGEDEDELRNEIIEYFKNAPSSDFLKDVISANIKELIEAEITRMYEADGGRGLASDDDDDL